jgi:hypothetical protein
MIRMVGKTVPLYLAISRVVFCNIPQFGMSKDSQRNCGHSSN